MAFFSYSRSAGRRTVFLFACVCALAPVRAFAQASSPPPPPSSVGSSQAIDDVRKDYRMHVGPFYVNPTILLKELGMDTNVFNAAGDQKSDFTFTITPQADVAIPLARRALLKATLGTDVVYYATYVSERSIDPQVTVRGEAYAHRLTLFAEEAYLNTRQRPNFEIDLRSRHLQNDFSAGASVRLTPRFSVEAAGLRGSTRFAGDAFFLGQRLQDTLNRDTTGVSLTARDKLSPLTTVSVRYENLQDRFPLSPARDTDSFRVLPGVEFKPKALVNGSAFVGYRSFTPKSGLILRYRGLVSQLALAYTLLGATTFGVTYDRDVNYSFEVSTLYFVDSSPGVFVRRALGGRFDVIANAARHRYTYQDLVGQLVTSAPRHVDTTDNFGANVGYRLKRQTRIGFGASYYTRNSTQVFRPYDGLRIGTTVTYGF